LVPYDVFQTKSSVKHGVDQSSPQKTTYVYAILTIVFLYLCLHPVSKYPTELEMRL
jgi:hypothetical protein